MHNVALPKHRYVWVDDSFVAKEPQGKLLPAVWFGISSHPGRAFGCHIMLECGATIIDLPLHCLKSHNLSALVEDHHELGKFVRWDCFGWDVEVFEPPYLSGLEVYVQNSGWGTAWFALDWVNNGWSDYPEQHKWLWVVAMHDGHLVAAPQNELMFNELSFTGPGDEGFSEGSGMPNGGIKRQTQIWSAE